MTDADPTPDPSCAELFDAPEARAGKPSRQSSQFSLAMTYCLLRGGRLPSSAASPDPEASRIRPSDLAMIPVAERLAVARALALEPSARWPSNTAFVETLRFDALAAEVLESASAREDSALRVSAESNLRRPAMTRLRSVAARLVGAGVLTALAGSGRILKKPSETLERAPATPVVAKSSEAKGRTRSQRLSAESIEPPALEDAHRPVSNAK